MTFEQNSALPGEFYETPMLVVDAGVHTATIADAHVDTAARWVVTGSKDRTVRIWSLTDGSLQRTIRLPAGPQCVGEVSTVAMSPDGLLIAVGGNIRVQQNEHQQEIYLFDRRTGALSIELVACRASFLNSPSRRMAVSLPLRSATVDCGSTAASGAGWSRQETKTTRAAATA